MQLLDFPQTSQGVPMPAWNNSYNLFKKKVSHITDSAYFFNLSESLIRDTARLGSCFSGFCLANSLYIFTASCMAASDS